MQFKNLSEYGKETCSSFNRTCVDSVVIIYFKKMRIVVIAEYLDVVVEFLGSYFDLKCGGRQKHVIDRSHVPLDSYESQELTAYSFCNNLCCTLRMAE